MPGRAGMDVASEPKVVQRVGSRAVDADEAVRIYQQSPTRVSRSTSTRWHQQVWENTGGKGPAPVAFQVGTMVRVDVERFGRTRNLADIGFHPDVPGYVNPMGKTSPVGGGTMVSGQQPAVRVNIRQQQVNPLGQTGQAPAPGRPRLPRSISRLTSIWMVATECRCCVMPMPQQTMLLWAAM